MVLIDQSKASISIGLPTSVDIDDLATGFQTTLEFNMSPLDEIRASINGITVNADFGVSRARF